MIIRDALKEEIPFIRSIRLQAYSEHENSVSPQHWDLLKQAITSEAELQEGAELIIAEINNQIAGGVVLFPPNTHAYEGLTDELDYCEIRMLFVTNEARGKGIAEALIQECIERTKAKGYKTIGLHTADFMQAAIALYNRLGFKRLPNNDFEPADDGVIVKAFCLSIN